MIIKNRKGRILVNVLRQIALTLVIIGAINWGLIGFFNFDLVAALFGGQDSLISRIIYSLVGLSGLYALTFYFTGMDEQIRNEPNYGTEFGEEFGTDDKNDQGRN